MLQDTTKSQEELAARDERFKLKVLLDKQRETQWISRFKIIDGSGEFDKITWEEALEGKGYLIKKSDVINSGKHADIWKAKKKDSNEELCVKVLRLKSAPKHYLHLYSRRNLKILMSFTHPAIVRIHKIFTLQNNEKIYIFMDLGEKGNLTKIIKKNGPMSEHSALIYFKDVADALHYLHSSGIAHRSLATDYIVVTSANRAKLCGLQGFGELCDLEQNNEITPCWMTHDQNAFIAPEALAGEPHCPFAEDIWSFGVCLYTTLCGGYPYDGYKDKEKLQHQVKDKHWLKKERAKPLSIKARSLLEHVFQLDPLRRPVIDELLKDPWFH